MPYGVEFYGVEFCKGRKVEDKGEKERREEEMEGECLPHPLIWIF